MATTAFSKAVKKRLIDLDQSPDWLCEKVSEKTGKYFDSSYLSKILRGVLRTPCMVEAICEILELEEFRKEGEERTSL